MKDDGTVENAEGKRRKLQEYGRVGERYLKFNIGTPSGAYPVRVHKLQAFQKFGEEAFQHACTRHLDGNAFNNSPDNIALGSHLDNAMDRDAGDRKTHGQHAANHLLAYDWAVVERDYFEGSLGFKKLATKYGMSTGTLSNHFNKIAGWTPKATGPDWAAVKDYTLTNNCSYKQTADHFNCAERSVYRQLGKRCDLN